MITSSSGGQKQPRELTWQYIYINESIEFIQSLTYKLPDPQIAINTW